MNLELARRTRLRDVIILRVSAATQPEDDILTSFVHELAKVCALPIILLTEGMELSTLSEAEMAAAGWTRGTSPPLKPPDEGPALTGGPA